MKKFYEKIEINYNRNKTIYKKFPELLGSNVDSQDRLKVMEKNPKKRFRRQLILS